MPEIHPKRVKIRGQRWTLCTHPMPEFNGLCDYPSTPRRHIWINPDLAKQKLLEILLHECLHAAFIDIDEEVIDTVGKDLAKILWDLGYRSHDLGDED